METQKLTELIDQYLVGTISPRDRKHLEQLMETDPAVATQVRDSQLAYKVIQYERNRLLKEKLRALDNKDFRYQGFFTKSLGMLAFLVLVLLSVTYLGAVYYNPAVIATRNLVNASTADKLISGNSDSVSSWTKAKNAFLMKDYESAILRYASLSQQTDSPDAVSARWNMLMGQLAMEGPTDKWKQALESFRLEAPEPLALKAAKLSALFESGFYRLIHNRFQEKLSSIKPRLI